MPYYTDAHPDSGLILSRAVGVIATEEVFTAVSLWTETLLGDPRLAVLLIDHSEADISSIRMEDVKQVAEVSAKLFEALPELFTVALYGRNLEYALGRMWQSWAELDDRSVVAHSLEEAEAILAERGIEIDLGMVWPEPR